MDESYPVQDVSYVPNIDNSKLTFGNTGLKFESTVLFIDLRGSTKLLSSHNKSTVAKIHKAYYYTIVKIAKSLGGENRSFNGDSLLVFFPGKSKDDLSNAVKAAMQMKYMLSNSNGISKHLKKYTSIDFGIGLGDGYVLCAKVGIGGTYDNKDLIWLGHPVNKSAVLSDIGRSPNHIYISSRVYDNLLDDVKYHYPRDSYGNIQTDVWGNPIRINMWNKTSFQYNGSWENCYYTSYHWVLD